MTRVVNAVEKMLETNPGGLHVRRLRRILECLECQYTQAELEEAKKQRVAIPLDLLTACGAIFLLGTQERGYRMIDSIEQAADLATEIRDVIEHMTGEMW